MRDRSTDPLSEYRRVNVEGTLSLAEQAAKAGVKRFVFLSSIKVNGEETEPGRPFTEADAPAPKDAYGVSKLEAELGLKQLAMKTGMEVVILRPTMVYGRGVKGNFARMMRVVSMGIPLPLRSVNNRRSMISLKNGVDLILCAAQHEKAAGNTYLMSDGDDLSTPELLRRLGAAMDKPPRLYPFPPTIMELGADLLKQRDIAQRLIGSLQVDISRARLDLNWSPIQSVDEGLRAAVP
jgi:nucleoside-diphosphate-sugar epimerase